MRVLNGDHWIVLALFLVFTFLTVGIVIAVFLFAPYLEILLHG